MKVIIFPKDAKSAVLQDFGSFEHLVVTDREGNEFKIFSGPNKRFKREDCSK